MPASEPRTGCAPASHAGTAAEVPPFPLYVRLEGAHVVCVGAGACAERKVKMLLAYGARLLVIAPEATDAVRRLADAGELSWEARPYADGDLDGALLVVCATDDAAVNHRVFVDAQRRGQLVNVVDDPANCNVILPSVLRRGKLQVAVSTAGAAPGLAGQIRRGLEREFPDWYGDYLDLLGEVRMLVKERIPGDTKLRASIYAKLYSSELDERIAAGERPDAEAVYTRIVVPLLESNGGAR